MTTRKTQQLPSFETFRTAAKNGILDDPEFLPLDAYGPPAENECDGPPAETGRANGTRVKSHSSQDQEHAASKATRR
jgi:hypothetical protein